MGLDEMTGSPNLTIVPDPVHLSRAALGAAASAGCCATNISTAACRSISRRAICCASSSSGSRTRACACVVGLEIEWYLLRVAQDALSDEQYRLSRRARAADQNRPGRARLFLPLESNMDLMQPVLSALAEHFDKDRTAAALDRERVGTGAARMHLRRAAGAGGRRPCAAVPHRDAANLPPDGIFRHLHVPAGAQGLLLQRLAPASVARSTAGAGATCSCRSASPTVCRRSAAPFSAV